jgi:hypothetical protein
MRLHRQLSQRCFSIFVFAGTCIGSLVAQTPIFRPDFSLRVSAAAVSLTVGGSSSSLSISAAALHGFKGTIQVKLSNLPKGVTASPGSFSLVPGKAREVSLKAGSKAAGAASMKVTGRAGAIVHDAPVEVSTLIDVVTHHYDIGRTGLNPNEADLTYANVNFSQFGLLRMLPVDGVVDAQPLLLSNVKTGRNPRNLVYVATEHDSVYAFDAQSGAQVWKVSMLGAGETTGNVPGCNQIVPEIGITATPVIDRTAGSRGAIFLTATSVDMAGKYHQRLHALDVVSGAELPNSPVEVTASYPGTGASSSGGKVPFIPSKYAERAGLLLLNGAIYTAWTSHCDGDPYTGWLMEYNESTLAQTSVLNVTPNGTRGAIWMAGSGLAADEDGYIYFLDGNGTFDAALNAAGFPVNGDYGNAFMKVSAAGGMLTVADYFDMSNSVSESSHDMDLGSGGAMVLPDIADMAGKVHKLAVGAGKDENIYVVDRGAMGKWSPDNDSAIYQEIDAEIGEVFSTPAYFNGTVYYAAVSDSLKAFPITDGKLATAPTIHTTNLFPYPGSTPAITANGTANGIVWCVSNTSPALLRAYRADTLAELYNSSQATGSRDHFGNGNKFVTPMVANGQVYVATASGVAVFGLLP